MAREVGGKSGKSGIREGSVSNRQKWSIVLNMVKGLRKLRTKKVLLSLAPTRGPFVIYTRAFGAEWWEQRQIEVTKRGKNGNSK